MESDLDSWWWFKLNPVQLLVLIAITNSILYAILILFKKENRRANYFLSLLLVSLSLTFTPYILDIALFNRYLWLSWMPFSLTYWIGPSLFFYIKSLTQPQFKFSPKFLWHFSPVFLNYLHSGYHLIFSDGFPYPFLHYTAEFLEFAAIFSILIYSYMAYKELSVYGQSILDQLSSIEHLHLRWMKHFIRVLSMLFVIIAIYLIITNAVLEERFRGGGFAILRNTFLILYAIAMYWLSLGGYRQSQTINNPIQLTNGQEDQQPDKILQSLQAKMKAEQYYLDPLLNLKGLSTLTGLSEKDISRVINTRLDKNFYTFVNEYRVASVKSKLADKNNDHLKIISLAYDSGFNSKATLIVFLKCIQGILLRNTVRR